MNRYLKLVHMEIHRFRYILASLMVVTMVCQFSSFILTIKRTLSIKAAKGLGYVDIGLPKILTFPWVILKTKEWFILPILLSITVLVLYTILIWYRDWFGRSTFIYRLLILPSKRWMLYVSKLTAIIMFVFSMIAFQLMLLVSENMIFKAMVPAELRTDSTFVEAISMNDALKMLLPKQFEQFIYSYGLGIVAVMVIFTAVLLERSYRRIGVLYAIAYFACCAILTVYPVFFVGFDRLNEYWYPDEIYGMQLGVCLLVAAISGCLGCWLLRKKITV
ncbi:MULTISPECIES: hypothetical protein [Paenibacillus]|uniref:ABC transporter permease n=1 Tax=Paenibacillus alvei TaxID=44250 RepID=A0ABT4E910_PAEAL|nr:MULTISPECIES: hypothetical protein [Paenibacillus]MCY9530231.1 hypothetical protein [Paenibacillus alvei]SDF66784.1 hypothetical protein SAMN04488689_106126 [Paenibacillus sp. cl6col]